MGNGARKDEPTLIPEKIRHLFEPAHINQFFEFCEKRYHLHPDWHKQFKEDLKRQPKGMLDQEYFFIWSNEHLNFVLQQLVRRKANIIQDIVLYLLSDRIRAKEQAEIEKRNFYRKGTWKNEPNKM